MPDGIRALLQLLRFPALFTAWSNILAAHLIATQGEFEWPVLLWSVAASSGLYLGGMVLNDCFDLAEDRRDRPQRPLPSGRIGMRPAWVLGGTLLAVGLFCAWLAGTTQLWIALALAAAILFYDGWVKAHSAGTLVMGACRYLNWLLGLAVIGLDAITVWLLPLPILLYITSITLLSRGETAPERIHLTLCLWGVSLSAASLAALFATGVLPQPWALVPSLLLLGVLLRGLAAGYRDLTPARFQHSVKTMLLGTILLDSLLVLGSGLWLESLLVLLLLIPGRLLAGLIYVT